MFFLLTLLYSVGFSSAEARFDTCNGAANGYYAISGCSQVYIACNRNHRQIMLCPTDTVFVSGAGVGLGSCRLSSRQPLCDEYREDIAGPSFCGNKNDGFYRLDTCDTRYAVCYGQNAYVGDCGQSEDYTFNGEDCIPRPSHCNTNSQSQEITQTEFTCQNVNSGILTVSQCDSQYAECQSNGALKVFSCNPGFHYDSYTARCEPNRVKCPAANGGVDVVTGSFNCRNAADGVYGARCSQFAVLCSFGKMHHILCPQGYVFDRATGKCQALRGHLLYCEAYLRAQEEKRELKQIMADIEGFCREWGEGLHPVMQCSRWFVRCHYNDKRIDNCKDGYSFDGFKDCVPKSQCAVGSYSIPEYGGNRDQPHLESVRSHDIPAPPAERPRTVVAPRPPPRVEAIVTRAPQVVYEVSVETACVGKAEGHTFADPQSCDMWYQCSHNRANHMACPAGTLWDTSLGICNHARDVNCEGGRRN